jgi:hypothetical protein
VQNKYDFQNQRAKIHQKIYIPLKNIFGENLTLRGTRGKNIGKIAEGEHKVKFSPKIFFKGI